MKEIKFYGIFHLPTGLLINKHIWRRRSAADKELKSLIEKINNGTLNDCDDYLQAEVRELKYEIGAE